MRRSKDPLQTLSIYEQRLSRRFLQTIKQLTTMQTERRALEQQQLEEMYRIAVNRPDSAHLLKPATLGFVCSDHDWQLFRERRLLLSYELRTTGAQKLRRSVRQILKKGCLRGNIRYALDAGMAEREKLQNGRLRTIMKQGAID